jgi:hypothetical protein
MWEPINPAPPPMQTLMTPLDPTSSGCAALNSVAKLFPIVITFSLSVVRSVKLACYGSMKTAVMSRKPTKITRAVRREFYG